LQTGDDTLREGMGRRPTPRKAVESPADWNFAGIQTDYTTIEPCLVSLLDRLGYPTTVKDLQFDTNATSRFADSRTRAQAALFVICALHPSAAQVIQASFACQSFTPDSTCNANISEFCDHQLDARITSALAAESNNSPDTATLWAQADRTATDQAPAIPLTTLTAIDLVSARVGNYQYSFQQGVLLDQLWVR
jgi:peptide/nickel transport system substrate-binding protein